MTVTQRSTRTSKKHISKRAAHPMFSYCSIYPEKVLRDLSTRICGYMYLYYIYRYTYLYHFTKTKLKSPLKLNKTS